MQLKRGCINKKIIVYVLLVCVVSFLALCGCNNNFNWKKSYIDFVKKEVDNKDINGKEIRYSLVNIDDDNIPELLYSGEGYINTHICWIQSGNVKHQFVCNQNFLYYEKKNLFYGFYFNHGISHDMVYTFENSNLKKSFEGTGNFTKNDFRKLQ